MITRKDVFKEIVSPKDVEAQVEPKMHILIYKAIYMAIRLILDIRSNQILMSQGKQIQTKTQTRDVKKVDNAVIKPTDTIE